MEKDLTLADAEARLDVLIDAGEESGWARAAQLLAEVDDGQLWKPEHRSFSAWLRSYALHKGCSESLLWRYRKAQKAYAAARQAVPELPEMQQAKVSAEAVVTAEKIFGDDRRGVAKLLGRVDSGEVGIQQVREMWRAARKAVGVRASRHQAKPKAMAGDGGGDAEVTRKLTAALASQASRWVWGAETQEEAARRKEENRARDFFTRDAVCVRTLTEFPVRVESGKRPRRVDVAAVCVENQTTADWMDVVMRGVEVKVSEYDLCRDEKMGDYASFFDFMYLAVPAFLERQAREAVPSEWGLLVYDEESDGISVAREPERLDAARREESLMTAVVKLARRDVK